MWSLRGASAPFLPEKGSLPGASQALALSGLLMDCLGIVVGEWKEGREKDVAGRGWVWLGSGLMGVSEAGALLSHS